MHALADPQPQWVGGTCRWSDPLYVRLRVALRGGKTVRRQRVHTSRLPCRTDVLDLLVAIDTTVGSWSEGKGTVDRLQQLVGRSWRPQDCALLEGYSGQLQRWTLAGTELLEAAPRVSLHGPCPSCGARFAYRDSAGERVRVRALRVSEDGCKCLACGAFWAPDRFEWLARLLGCEPLPA